MSFAHYLHMLSDDQKLRIKNDVDERILPNFRIFRKLETKPRICRLSSGKWINTNTCLFWSDSFEWQCAIHWCDLENSKIN